MSRDIDFESVERITVGALGPPGNRTFLVQAQQGGEAVCLVVEKQHVVALTGVALKLLQQIGSPEEPAQASESSMAIDEDLTPEWRVGAMGLGYEEDKGLVYVVCQEIFPPDPSDPEDKPKVGATARFGMNRSQLTALVQHGMEVVSRGRRCPLCGNTTDVEGHRCYGMNGHSDLPEDG